MEISVKEGVPIGLVIYSQLGKQLGVSVKQMESVIHISSALLDSYFIEEGRTLPFCCIEEINREQILEYVKTGEKS